MTKLRLLPVLIGSALATAAMAQTSATGVISVLGMTGTSYNYDIDLHNAGSTGIETFWFSWVPGVNFMPDMPTSISDPTGWTDTVVGGPGAYSIQFKSSTGLASTQFLDGFQFTSADSLSVLEGNAQGSPILTSTVYSGQPFSGTSDQFVVTAAPEPPAWLALGSLAIAGLALRKRARGLVIG